MTVWSRVRHVDGEVERLAHAHVGEGAAGRVDRDVQVADGWSSLQLGCRAAPPTAASRRRESPPRSSPPRSYSAAWVSGSGMMRMRMLSASGDWSPVGGVFASTMESSCDQETNRQGPLPMGAWSKSAPRAGVGTIAAAGIASSLGKMLSGSSRVNTTVESSATTSPVTPGASPLLKACAPWMGYRGHGRAPRDRGASARSIEARPPGGDGPAVVEPGWTAGEKCSTVADGSTSQGVASPGRADADVELDEVVEEQRHGLAGGDVGGKRGIE